MPFISPRKHLGSFKKFQSHSLLSPSQNPSPEKPTEEPCLQHHKLVLNIPQYSQNSPSVPIVAAAKKETDFSLDQIIPNTQCEPSENNKDVQVVMTPLQSTPTLGGVFVPDTRFEQGADTVGHSSQMVQQTDADDTPKTPVITPFIAVPTIVQNHKTPQKLEVVASVCLKTEDQY